MLESSGSGYCSKSKVLFSGLGADEIVRTAVIVSHIFMLNIEVSNASCGTSILCVVWRL